MQPTLYNRGLSRGHRVAPLSSSSKPLSLCQCTAKHAASGSSNQAARINSVRSSAHHWHSRPGLTALPRSSVVAAAVSAASPTASPAAIESPLYKGITAGVWQMSQGTQRANWCVFAQC